MLTVKVSTPDGVPWRKSRFFDAAVGVPALVDFRVNDFSCRSADFWFVIEDVHPEDTSCSVPRERTIFLSAEAAWPSTYYSDSRNRERFLAQFGLIYTCHGVGLPSARSTIPFLPWLIDWNHRLPSTETHARDLHELMLAPEPPKRPGLSVVCSAQRHTAGHRLRLEFVERLNTRLGPRLYWFGNGIRPMQRKWDAIAPFKYSLVLENDSRFNVVTEKLYDAYLGYSFPIYWGAPNIETYFPGEALEPIHIEDMNGSLDRVEEILEEDPFASRLDTIRQQRARVLSEFNPFVRIQDIAIQHHAVNGALPSVATSLWRLDPHHQARATVTSRTRRYLSRVISPK